MQPPPRKDPGIVCPVDVVVTKKRSSADQTSSCKCEQQPALKITGKMQSWQDGEIRLKLARRAIMIPVDDIESVEIRKTSTDTIFLSSLGGALLGVLVFIVSVYAYVWSSST